MRGVGSSGVLGLRHVMGCRGFRGHWGDSGICAFRWPAGGVGGW